MNKFSTFFDNAINAPIQKNEQMLHDFKLENKLTIEKYLDKVQKRSILYQDKQNKIVSKINDIKNENETLKAQMSLDSSLIINHEAKILNNLNEIEKIENDLKAHKEQFDTKLTNYSQKIKVEIGEFEKTAAQKEKRLADAIAAKNKKLVASQNSKYSQLRQKVVTLEDQYNLKLENLVKEKNQALKAIVKSEQNIYEKQLDIVTKNFVEQEKQIHQDFQKQQKPIMRKIKIGNYFENLKSTIFYKRLDNSLFHWIIKNKLIFLILMFALIVGSIYPRFFHIDNWLDNILQQNIVVGLLAVGMTFVILTGSIDLSVGSTMALSGGLSLYLHTSQELSLFVSLIIGLVVALALSLIMGILSSYGKLQSFIVTLVGLLVFRGILNVFLKGSPATIKDNDFVNFIGSGQILFLPSVVFIFLVVTIVLIFVLKWTKFGRYVYATGSNATASKAAGIKTKLIITLVFLISGTMVYLASIAYIGNVKSIEPQTGVGYELSAIAAVVLGGTSLSGGKGSIGKTIVGWLLISILNNALVFLRVDSNMQLVFRGVIILLAVLFDNQFNVKAKMRNILVKARGY